MRLRLRSGQVHYFPKQLMQRINASELSFDPDLMFCDSKEFAASEAEHRALQQENLKPETTSTSAVVGAAVSSVLMLALALYVGLGV